ncbi:MAG: lipid A biosynthesis protein [Ginsengibacter sp.]
MLAFYIIRYRRKVVFNNLLIAFPEKSDYERQVIAKAFYHNLIDSFLESIKLLTLSQGSLLKRTSCNFDLIKTLAAEGKNIQFQPGHQFNVEFYNLLYSASIKEFAFVFVYMPISNKNIDRIFYKIRSRFGSILVAATQFREQKKLFEGTRYGITLGADQNPSYIQGAFWMNFFDKPVPFLPGPANSAVKKNAAIVLVEFIKIKRGYYRFENTLLTKDASEEDPKQLTRKYRDFIESRIKDQPANYLWTHKRWKHEFKDDFHPLWSDDISLKR